MENRNLTEHFTIFELTRTDLPQFQERNRILSVEQIEKLTVLAKLLEHVRFILGTPLTINSGYRCPDLNKAVGSTARSQHLHCEAADFTPGQQDLGHAFRMLWRDIKDNGTNVGQLIYETQNRPYGVTSWLHISVGTPYRPIEKCAQVLRMTDGKYELIA